MATKSVEAGTQCTDVMRQTTLKTGDKTEYMYSSIGPKIKHKLMNHSKEFFYGVKQKNLDSSVEQISHSKMACLYDSFDQGMHLDLLNFHFCKIIQ